MHDDLHQALDDIRTIRSRIAAGTAYRGYGPAAVAASAVLALGTWGLQSAGLAPTGPEPLPYVIAWAATAAAAVGLVGWEMRARSRRHHAGLADDMVLDATGRFLGSGVAGALLAVAFLARIPDQAWMLPGLWQVLVGLGVFASAGILPRPVLAAGAWYVVSGMALLCAVAGTRTLEPWHMGLPFAAGQAVMALALHLAHGDGHD